MTPPTEQSWHQRPSRGGVILGAEEAKGTERGKWSEVQPGLPPGLRGFLAGRCSGAVLCVPAVYTCSPQPLLDRELRRGAHTGCCGGAPTTLRPEHSAPPNSLMAGTGPSGVGSSCGVRVGWGGLLPRSPLGAARDPTLGLGSPVQSTVVNRGSENKYPCLFPIIRGKAFRISPSHMILAFL